MVGGINMAISARQTKQDVIFELIINVLIVIIILIVLYPLIFVVSASLSNPMKIMQGEVWLLPKEFTLSSYEKVFRDPSILTGYRNTILYTVVGTAINLVMTIMGAYPLSRKDLYGRGLITAIFTFTMFFSGGLIPTYLLIKNLGMLNTFWVMVIPNAVAMYNMIIMRTFFQNTIPVELLEAASIDGCSNLRFLLKIVLPLSTPIIAVMVLFYGVGHWNAFFNALIYLTDEKKYPLQLILREILLQSQVQEMTDMENYQEQLMQAEGIKYAVIIVSSLPVLMLYPFLQRYFVKGVMIGAIKG